MKQLFKEFWFKKMIQVQVTPKSIDSALKVISSKVKQAEVIISPNSLTEISKAIFMITSKKFLSDLSIAAKSDPQRFHHLYEWGEVGNNKQKLFLMKRGTVQYGNLRIDFIPLKSSKPVPIPARLLNPEPSGKVVSAQNIFKDKMNIMENNIPVHIYTKRTIAFTPDGNNIVFVPKGKLIEIMNPGGSRTSHSLEEFSNIWYLMKAPTAITNSRLIRQIGNEVAKVLNKQNSNSSQVYETIRRVTSSYSQEISIL